MEWRLFGSTFAAVFLAELGDKTQLATMSLAAGGSSRWMVFFGSAAALVCTSALAVLVGDAVARVVPAVWIKRVAGLVFVGLGVLFLLSKVEPEASTTSTPASSSTDAPADASSRDDA